MLFSARSSYASAVLEIVIMSVCPSVRPSVRPSVTRVLCGETKEHTVYILIPHETAITLVFYRGWWAMFLFTWNLHLVIHPLWKTTSTNTDLYAYNVSTVRAFEKSSIIANSRLRSFEWVIDEVCTLPAYPQRVAQNQYVVFVNVQSNKVCHTKFLCVKTSSGKVVAEPFPCPTVYRCWR